MIDAAVASDVNAAGVDAAGEVTAPRWFETIAVGAGALVAGVGLVGTVLALAGSYDTALALGGGGAAAICMTVAASRAMRPDPAPARPGAVGAALVATAIALVFIAVASIAPSQHVLIDRDPGSYTSTARWLVRDGSLRVDGTSGGLGDEEALEHESYAVYDSGDGTLQFQFNHLTSVVLAAAYDLGGHRAMFRLPGLVAATALLAVYAVAVRATRRPWASLVAPALLATSVPVLYVGRDTFSESFTMLLLWSAVLTGVVAVRRRRVAVAMVAGVLLGATVATRIDSLLYLTVAAPLLAWSVVADPAELRTRLRTASVVGLSAVAVAVVGVVDLQFHTGGYLHRHSEQVELLRWATITSVVVSIAATAVLVRWPRCREMAATVARRSAGPLAVLVAVVMALGWLVRPRIQAARGVESVSLIAALQEMEGVPIDGFRRYGERSLQWAGWYLGVLGLAVAIVGTALVVRRVLRARATPAAIVSLALLVAVGGLYFWRPSIVPDQPWASRRFVPAVYPALAVMAASAVAAVATCGRLRAPARSVAAGVLGIAVVAAVALPTWQLRGLREQHGYLGVLLEACDLAGPDASVVVVGAPATNSLPQSIRSWCGVPAASLAEGADAAAVARVRADVAAAGRTLTWVGGDASAIELAAGPGAAGSAARTSTAVETQHAERTLLRPPRRYEPPGAGWSLHVRREGP